jgi:hypothetical protein
MYQPNNVIPADMTNVTPLQKVPGNVVDIVFPIRVTSIAGSINNQIKHLLI